VDNPLFLILFALSMLCLLFLLGLYAYSGSFVPWTKGLTAAEARWLWIEWSPIVVIPAVTLIWWLVSWLRRHRS
jgi:membrane protein DedA with SNARE-associated domain